MRITHVNNYHWSEMSANKLNLHMTQEMQASFKLADGRHNVQILNSLTAKSFSFANKDLLSLKLETSKAKENTNKKQNSKYSQNVQKSVKSIQHTKKSLDFTKDPNTKIEKTEKRNMFCLRQAGSKKSMLKQTTACARKDKKLPAKPKLRLDLKKDQASNYSRNIKLLKKNYAKFQHIEYDSEQLFQKRCTNSSQYIKGKIPYVDKDNSYYTKVSKCSVDVHEDNFHVPQIFKLKQSQFHFNFDTPKLERPGKLKNSKGKFWLGKSFSIPVATVKTTKIFVFEDKTEILYSRKEQQEYAIANKIEKNSAENRNLNTQDELSELSFFENSLKDNNVLGVIKGSLEFFGTLLVTLLCGQIFINGYEAIKCQPLTIYSPKGINWVSIKTKKRKQSLKEASINFEELNKYFSQAQLENIMSKYNNQEDAIVLLQRNSAAQNLISIFNKNMNQNIFPQIHSSNRPHCQTEFLLNCLIQRASRKTILQAPPVWNNLKLNKRSRLIVVGGKSVGKSSLVRYLINRNLRRFGRLLLIDLDIGQPEVFIPQTISCSIIDTPLLGPGFFYNREPEKAFVVGDVNIVMCVQKYVTAVKYLMEFVHNNSDYAQIPWLVNTMGYNKGFGVELIAFIIQAIKPTDVVQISSVVSINNFDVLLEWKLVKNIKSIIFKKEQFKSSEMHKYVLHEVSTAVPSGGRGIWSMSSKDLRYSNLLARLSECLKRNSMCLSDCQPFRASLEFLEIVHPISKKSRREELIAGMEANVVYMARSTSKGIPECLGIAVVRALDYEHKLVYLLPAISSLSLAQVNCLILAGELTVPSGFFKDQGPVVTNDVPYVFQFDDTNFSKAIKQIYCRPSAFLN